MNVPDIAAIVVTHHSASTIDDCLARLRAADGVAAIRVVDNASGDDTVAIVQRHAAADARLRFVANPDNPGFAVACNQGAAALDDVGAATWLAFVNPDCMVEADTLARLRRLAPGVLYNDLKATSDYVFDGRVACPTLFILGSLDVMTPPRNAKALIDKIPQAKTVVLEGSGHALMAEAPDATLDALIAFIS